MDKQSLQRSMLICLESIYLLYNTKNIETLKNRFELLRIHLPTLAEYDSAEGYLEAFSETKSMYHQAYHDHPSEMPDYQLACVFKPTTFNLYEFYTTCLAACTARYVKEKKNEIDKVIKQSAKKKRVEEILLFLDGAKKELLNSCTGTSKYDLTLAAFQQMQGEVMVLKIADEIK